MFKNQTQKSLLKTRINQKLKLLLQMLIQKTRIRNPFLKKNIFIQNTLTKDCKSSKNSQKPIIEIIYYK